MVNRTNGFILALTVVLSLHVPCARSQSVSPFRLKIVPQAIPSSNSKAKVESDQQAAAVLHKAQNALGGRRNIQAIHDVTCEVEMVNLDTKEHARSTSEIIFPNVVRLTTDGPLGELVAFSDGDSGWASSAMGLDDRLPDWQIKASRQDLFRQLETLMQSDGNPDRKVEFVERGKVEDRPADILKISSATAGSVRVWIDAGSGDLLELEYQRIVGRGSGPLVTDFFSDYQWVNKTIRIPFRIHTLSDGQPYMDTEVVRVEYNKGLKGDVLSKKPAPKQH